MRDFGAQKLLAKVRRGIDQDPGRAVRYGNGGTQPMVTRIIEHAIGIALIDLRHTCGRSASEDYCLHIKRLGALPL